MKQYKSRKYVKKYNEALTLKTLSCAALAALSFGSTCAAEEITLVPDKPTLDAQGKESAYTLTPATEADTQNVITRYELKPVVLHYDLNTGERVEKPVDGVEYKVVQSYDLVPHKEFVSLKKTEYSTENADTTKVFGWTTDDRGNRTFGEIEKQIAGQTTITVNYNSQTNKPINNTPAGGNINGDIFVGNSTAYTDSNNKTYGGAIYNDKTIGDIKGTFIGNSTKNYGMGSAIYNSGTVGNIEGVFIGNSNSAIYNRAPERDKAARINNVTGTFIGNSASYGGAIYNSAESYYYGPFYAYIGNITGDFIGNTASKSGGAIALSYVYVNGQGTAGNITGDFIGNTAGDNGGAIYSAIDTGNVTGNFINNTAGAGGGALYGTFSDITGNFINNSANDSRENNGFGGAIYLEKAGTVKGNFLENTATNSGGAISVRTGANKEPIDKIQGKFVNNSAKRFGGGIDASKGLIREILADFSANAAEIGGGAISVGAYGNLIEITGNFVNNLAKDYGGAICYDLIAAKNTNEINGNDAIVNSNFVNNKVINPTGTSHGGAIYTGRDLDLIAKDGFTSLITGNYVEDKDGRRDEAIYLGSSCESIINMVDAALIRGSSAATLNLIAENNGKFIINDKIVSAPEIGAKWIYEYGTNYASKTSLTYCKYSDINDNIATYKYSTNGKDEVINGTEQYVITLNNLDENNTVTDTYRYYVTSNKETVGDSEKEVDTYNILNPDNTVKETIRYYYTYESGISTYYILDDDNNVVKTVVTPISNIILAKDAENILVSNPTINIKGDSTGTVELNNNIESYKEDGEQVAINVSLDKVTLHLGAREDVLDGNNLYLNSGTVNMLNGKVGVSALNKLTVNGDTNFAADVDLKNKEMDRFTAKDYGEHHGNLNVVGMNLLTEANPDETVTAVYFAEPGLKDHVTTTLSQLPQNEYQNFTALTPIYKYNVVYDKDNEYDGKGDGGYFLFTKGDKYFVPNDNGGTIGGTTGGTIGSTGNPSDAFNPAVLSAPVSSVAASQATMNETFKYVFEHADAFTQFPAMHRLSQIESNKYALSTDYNKNLGSLDYDQNNKAVWVRPYTTFESMNLKNGPKVDAITYGTLVGYDGDFVEGKKGWNRLGTSYIGYNGSQLDYAGNDTTLNGGILGFTETFYKGNFWTALTASAGASVGETSTMYGKEEYTTLLGGIGSKTGYNFEFKEGKYILQPIMFMSYTFVNTFDYTNAAGVKIKTNPAHSIQLNPSVRFITNCKNGWQPYASVGMVWNVMNESKVTANNVKLPEMSMKPYVEYGVGVQKHWSDKFSAFGQAMVRNGGRNGIALTAGFRWALGRDGDEPNKSVKVKNTTKVGSTQNVRPMTTGAAAPMPVRTVVKQLKR